MGYTSVFTVYDGATAGDGKDPTVNYTDTDALAAATRHFRSEDFDTIKLWAVLVAGTAPTSIEFLLEESPDDVNTAADTSTWSVMPVAIEAAGAIGTQETIRTITWAVTASSDTAHPWLEPISAPKFRVRAKRTGGAADTRIMIQCQLSTRSA